MKKRGLVFLQASRVSNALSSLKPTRPTVAGENIFDFLCESVVELKKLITFALPKQKRGMFWNILARSSSGPGRRPFTAETRVRFPYGSQKLN
jgi:hypothetical protein